VLPFFKLRLNATRDPAWMAADMFWVKVFALSFAMGVVLGIMLFDASRMAPWVQTTATFLVALGTTMSAFWINMRNSWMHTCGVGTAGWRGAPNRSDTFLRHFNPVHAGLWQRGLQLLPLYRVPEKPTIDLAASAPESLIIILTGVAIVLPIIIAHSTLS